MDDQKSANSADTPVALDRRALLRLATATGIVATSVGQSGTARADLWEEGDEQCRVQQALSKVPDLDENQLADFVAVSETLTGQRPLQRRLAAQYLERFARLPDYFPKLQRLVQVHKAYSGSGNSEDLADRIMNNREADSDDIRAAAEQVIYLWYVSAFFLQTQKEQPPNSGQFVRTGPQIWIYGTTEQYEQSLLWRVVKAHAPMMPGGKRNYWAARSVEASI